MDKEKLLVYFLVLMFGYVQGSIILKMTKAKTKAKIEYRAEQLYDYWRFNDNGIEKLEK